MAKGIVYKLGLVLGITILSSFTFSNSETTEVALFSCVINNKPFLEESSSAILRKITGGETQLSITNERFIKFSFLNPKPMERIDLSNPGRRVFIRYEDPASLQIGQPVSGYVFITSINQKEKLVSGEFEFDMELKTESGPGRIVKIQKGKFENLPIEIR